MPDTERILALMRGEGRGLGPGAARAGLWLLSRVYAFGIGAYWLAYRTRLLRRVRLRPVVFSVGNLTVGGAGKTTTIRHLAGLIRADGLRPAILSYGYRAAAKDAVGVVSDGNSVRMNADEAGDEATLLARALPGVPVLIGRRRVLSGAEADRQFQPDVLLCDDAFQYWRLERDIDLLLIDALEPWGYGHVLPRGLLREPKRRAGRATAFLITHADLAGPERVAQLEAELRRFDRPVWTARHAPIGLTDLAGGEATALDDLRGLPVLAVSSLGDPASFEATLSRAGAAVTPARFPDHHRYTEDDVRAVEAQAARMGRRIVTTAKDAVKIAELAPEHAWWVLQIALAVSDETSFERWATKAIRESIGKRLSLRSAGRR